MQIQLNHIIPKPLENLPFHSESIWGSEINITSSSKVLLNASSGKGKSTFSSILYGTRFDYRGTLTYDGKNAFEFTKEEWTDFRRCKISIVFQDLQLFPNLTVKENLLIKNLLTGFYEEAQIFEFIKKVQLEDKWEIPCGILSMGQQQRIAIVRSFLQPFEWLYLDEPFSHLDESNSTICLNLINEEVEKRNAGFVLTSLGNKHGFVYDRELKL